jgi:hypothetical protein
VVVGQPYDPNITVRKLEYTGHVQKSIGARLKRLVTEKRGTKLHESKLVGGKVHLT